MGGCMCFGRMLPKPASKFPVKRYNILVPDIFPIKPPQVDEDLQSFTIKKIEKLEEYVTKNPQRASKVSRRLKRRIEKEISRRLQNYGYVKIAVHAYAYLLSKDNVNIYALELIKGDDCVIKLLLKHPSIHLRILGAELLAHFVRQQNDSDNLPALESCVPILAKNCRKKMPEDLDDAEELKKVELKVACLRGLRGHVGLIQKISEAPKHLDLILTSVLDNLDCKVQPQPSQDSQHAEPSMSQRPSSPMQKLKHLSMRRSLEHSKSTSMDFNFLGSMNIPGELSLVSSPANVATQVMTALGSLTRLAGNAEVLLESLLRLLDKRKDWSEGEVVGTVFDLMHSSFSREHQQLLLFTVVIKHAAFANHPIAERTYLIQLAINEGMLQDIHLSVSVLVHCLAYLPVQLPPPIPYKDGLIRTVPELRVRPAIPNSFLPDAQKTPQRLQEVDKDPLVNSPKKIGDPKEDALRCVILQGISKISERVEGAMQIMDTVLGVLSRFNHSAGDEDISKEEEVAVLECVLAAVEAAAGFPEETGRLPTRNYEHAVKEMVGLLCNVSSPQSVALVYRLIRLTLSMAPSRSHQLLQNHVSNFLSALFHGVQVPGIGPEIFAEMAATFSAIMERAPDKNYVPAFQMVHTLWGRVVDNDKMLGMESVDSTQKCAILLLCRSMIENLASVMKVDLNAQSWTKEIEQQMQPSLKLEGGLLFGGTAAFPISMEEPCSTFLNSAMSHERIKTILVDTLKGNGYLLGENIDMARSEFSPESIRLLKSVSQMSLISTPDSSLTASDAGSGQDFSKRVMQFWRHSQSLKRDRTSQISIDAQEFLKQPQAKEAAELQQGSHLSLGDVLKIVDEVGLEESDDDGVNLNDLVVGIDTTG